MTVAAPKPVRRARLVAGIALHFLAPAYGAVLVADAALGHAPHSWATWLPHALALGGWFLPAYGGTAMLACGVAALADRRRPAPALPDAHALPLALHAARGRFGPDADAQLDRIAALAAPDGASPVVADILRLLAASGAAPGSIDPAIQQQTARALGVLADALAEEGGAARDQALVVARYIDLKYRQGQGGEDTL